MSDLLTFEIEWHAGKAGRSIGRDYVRRQNLDDAITAACNLLKNPRSENTKMAHGFYVQVIDAIPSHRKAIR